MPNGLRLFTLLNMFFVHQLSEPPVTNKANSKSSNDSECFRTTSSLATVNQNLVLFFFFCWHTADTSLPEISNKQMNFISIWTQDPGQRDSLSSANILIKKTETHSRSHFSIHFFELLKLYLTPKTCSSSLTLKYEQAWS